MKQGQRQHDYAARFYNSISWQQCREAYRQSVGGLCEKCMRAGIATAGAEVHHKIKLSPANIDNPEITLNFANLELLCEKCHHEAHDRRGERRWKVDEDGRLIL